MFIVYYNISNITIGTNITDNIKLPVNGKNQKDKIVESVRQESKLN